MNRGAVMPIKLWFRPIKLARVLVGLGGKHLILRAVKNVTFCCLTASRGRRLFPRHHRLRLAVKRVFLSEPIPLVFRSATLHITAFAI